MENLNAILEAGGASMRQTFETRVYLRNMASLDVVDEVFLGYFNEDAYPVRSTIEIARLNEDYEKGWEPNHDIEVQCSAHLGLTR
jgi:2-iminobutanoate/2-iminopropanoate deaminase